MKIKNLLGAALSMTAALVMTACSSSNDDNMTDTPQSPSTSKTIPYTVSVNGGATTRATVKDDPTDRQLYFATGDKLYITGTGIHGVLEIQSGVGETSNATFSGNLTYNGSGSPADGLSLTATLVSAQQYGTSKISVDGNGAVTVNYPTTAYCADVATAVQEYSNLTGTSTYGAKAFTLTQQTAFLNFEITFTDGTTTSTELSAVVNNNSADICTANVTTVTDGGVKAKFVLPVAAGTTLSSANVKMGDKEAISFGDSQTLTGKVYNVKKTQAPAGPLATPLTIEALTAGTILVRSPKEGMQYSLNGGAKTSISATEDPKTISVEAGDKVAFYGNGTTITSYQGTWIDDGTAYVKVYGNIMSLVDEEGFATATTLATESAFTNLFYGNVNLKDASGLLLPATTLAEGCYSGMFEGCTSLSTAPALPATTLAERCYSGMFWGCTSLSTAPALPATTLARKCYECMFLECTSLTTAPELPATTLAEGCYVGMFEGCTGLTAAPALPATMLAQDCYYYMFYECASLTAAPELPATTLTKSCYKFMFSHCTSLTTAPELPATTLAQNCYERMFDFCTSLTAAPKLPATTLAQNCYESMFFYCTSLTAAPELPAATLVDGCYISIFRCCTSLTSVTCLATNIDAKDCTGQWLGDVSSTGTFTKAASMTSWGSGPSGIPDGWTVVDKE